MRLATAPTLAQAMHTPEWAMAQHTLYLVHNKPTMQVALR